MKSNQKNQGRKAPPTPEGEIRFIKSKLEECIGRMKHLLETIGEHGRPLNKTELLIIRQAISPAVQEAADEVVRAFIVGNPDFMSDSFSELDHLCRVGTNL